MKFAHKFHLYLIIFTVLELSIIFSNPNNPGYKANPDSDLVSYGESVTYISMT